MVAEGISALHSFSSPSIKSNRSHMAVVGGVRLCQCHAQLDLPAATSTSTSTLAIVAATTTAV